MSKIQSAMEDYRGSTRRDLVVEMQGYVKEFTRHSNDVLLNLNELRHRNILTDATLLVGSARLRAHCAVLIACRSVCRYRQDTWAICFLSSSLLSFFPFPPSFLCWSCFQQNALLFLKMVMSFFTLLRPFQSVSISLIVFTPRIFWVCFFF